MEAVSSTRCDAWLQRQARQFQHGVAQQRHYVLLQQARLAPSRIAARLVMIAHHFMHLLVFWLLALMCFGKSACVPVTFMMAAPRNCWLSRPRGGHAECDASAAFGQTQ